MLQVYRPPSLVEQSLIDRQQWVDKGSEWFVRPALDRYWLAPPERTFFHGDGSA